MSIQEEGRKGERLALKILTGIFSVDFIFQADWNFKKADTWYVAEVKHVGLYTPPPYVGTGLKIRQAKARMKYFRETGVRCLLLTIEKLKEDKVGDIYWEWLDILEAGEHFDTKDHIRIYPITSFHRISNKGRFC